MAVPRLLILFLIVLLSAGCLAQTGGDAPDSLDAPPADSAYVSRLDDPAAGALYHFAAFRLLAAAEEMEAAEGELLRAIELDPRSEFLRLSLADLYLRTGEETKALRAAEDTLIQHPDSIDAHLLLGNYYFGNNRYDKAAGHFRRVVEIDPQKESAYLHLGIAFARAGDVEKAVAVIKELLEQSPDSLVGRLALARLYRQIDLTVLAEEAYRQIIDKRPGYEDAYLELGEMLEEKKAPDEAVAVYRLALERDERNFRIRHHIVGLYIRQNRYDAALEELREILELNPDDLEARRKVGLIHLEQEDWSAAEKTFADILAGNPDLAQIRYYLGTAYERQEKWRQALEAFRRIPADADVFDDALSHVTFLLMRLDRVDEAIALLEDRLAENFDRPGHYVYLASLYEAREDHAAAIDTMQKGVAAYPDQADMHYRLALLLERQGRRDEAIAGVRRAVEIDPDHAEGLNFLAYTYAEQGENLDQALILAQRALQLKAEGHIVDTLGWVYFKMGRYEEALRRLQRAAQMLAEDAVVREHLGDAYRALGRTEEARAAYRKALELAPEEAEGLEEKLRSLPGAP